MKTLDLDFTQRFKLIELLGAQSGSLAKTTPYLRVLNLVRFTDRENDQITRVKVSDTMVSVMAPSNQPDFGRLNVSLEDADCRALLELIENHQGFTTSDHGWADPVVAALK